MAPSSPRFLFAAAAAALSAACASASGGAAANAPATPAGVMLYMQLDRTEVEGELLEVGDSGFVLVRGSQVAYVPFRAVRVGRFQWGAPVVLRPGAHPRVVLPVTPDAVGSAARLDELRLMSRYPGGMSAAVRAALLAAYGQPAPELVQR